MSLASDIRFKICTIVDRSHLLASTLGLRKTLIMCVCKQRIELTLFPHTHTQTKLDQREGYGDEEEPG